ncbi:vigilin [Trichonephila inaurata madagascariensis]|uniref:Vigilin n=1 Tax=Trichonephila inaurata madagascariensis TaxID=2747483 RepID=A0A8X6J9S4_9ARAC|nr:vigilin [Trichonephila inaurata madagascariensis]
MMPVHNNILEESMPYEAAFSYDELFPSLPENELRPEQPAVDMGQWTQKMKVKSSVITQVFRVPVEERKFRDMNSQRFGEQGEQAKICSDIMQKTGAHIEISSSKDQSLTILVTGKEDSVLKARRLIVKELQTQALISISIPKEHHRFILGKGGKKLTDLELSTATKISVPRPDENSDLIKISGTKEGIDKARHEIQLISDEQSKLAFERLVIPKMYHPFIFGPFNETLNQMISETKARINIPPASVMKDELTIAGEKEAVAKAKARVLNIYEERKRNCQSVSVEVPKNQHKYIIGPRGQTIQEILQETGVSIEMPPPDMQSDTITLRGEQAKLGPALTLVYSKANSVKTEHMDVPSWLHKYIIGKKGANIKHMTQDLSKVQVDFTDESIKVEGPPEEVNEACKRLREMIDNLRKQVAYEEVKVNPAFHRHIIGKNGSNINRLKEDTKTLINIPSDNENDVVRIEGAPEGVAQVKKLLMEMVHKMENEVSKDLVIEQRFHRNIIGAKGEKIREIRDKFNQVNITFPEPGLKSDKVTIRGPKSDVDACYKYLHRMNEDMKLTNFSVEVPIYKQNHKFIIGKGGANIKKIRDETNTKIDLPAEGAESDVIIIRGRKEDVLVAKKKILEIQEELDNVITQEIMIPAKHHNAIIGTKGRLIRAITEECGGVTIKFPTGGTGSDKVSIRGPKDDVMKAKKRLLEISSEKQLVGFTAEIKANPEQHKFLIGKNGASIKKVREKTGARIVFPNENDDDKNTITIIGRKEEVEAAKKELENLIAQLKDTADTTIDIDPKHHRYFVARGAEVLRQISNDYGGVTVSFPKVGSNSSKVILKGAKDFLEPAKQRLFEIVEDLEAMVTVECVIPQEHHRTVLGTRGSKVQNIQRQFNVTIKFPDREKPEDADKVTMNGDIHADGLEPESNQKNIIIIKGRQENCDAAAKALLDIVPVTEEVEVPYDLHRFIIGQKGRDVRSMMEMYDVNIIIPPQNEHSDIITIKGPPENVAKTKEALKERIEQLELEKQDRLLRSFQLTVEVDPQYHPKIIGRSGAVITKIRKDHNVQINFPEREGANERVITITGYEKDAEAAKEAILKLVQEQEDMHKEDVSIDSRIHSRIIGSRGRNVVKIMEQFKVDIRFPRSSDPDPDIVVILGAEDDVLDAKDHLLNLEEEYLQDLREKDLMRQYTMPPSRNGTHDSEANRNDKGFVVKGAPWDKKGAAPDTTNTQEFPSFGSGGDMPPKPVAWGPSRR